MAVRFGLVGAGPWAGMFHAPMLAAGTGVELTAVWARNYAAAATLVSQHGGTAMESIDDLLKVVDAVAFAVPPAVQVELAKRAARAGKHLMLEKPLAYTVEDAEDLARAVDDAGVISQLVLTNRFRRRVMTEIENVRVLQPFAGLATLVLGGSCPGGPFHTPWRMKHGALLDVGPHVFDLLDHTLGPLAAVSATGDPRRFVALSLAHTAGLASQASLSITAPGLTLPSQYTFWTAQGAHTIAAGAVPDESSTWHAIIESFVSAVEDGCPPPVGVHRGLFLQRVIRAAEESLASQGKLIPVDAEASSV